MIRHRPRYQRPSFRTLMSDRCALAQNCNSDGCHFPRLVTANLYPVDVVNKETGQVDGTAYKYQFVPLGTARTINVYEAVFPSPPPPPPPPDGCCTVFPLGICSEYAAAICM
eukprot:5635724-Pleurochrysis_carterae.AAC.1